MPKHELQRKRQRRGDESLIDSVSVHNSLQSVRSEAATVRQPRSRSSTGLSRVFPMLFLRFTAMAFASLCLVACDSSEQANVESEKKRIECANRICDGDVLPPFEKDETVLKLNHQWFIGPRKYFSAMANTASFEWWGHRPLDPAMPRPRDAQAAAIDGKGYDFAVSVFLVTHSLPAPVHDYRLIEMAQENGWILSREVKRPGLEVVHMSHVKGPDGQFIDQGAYFIATDLEGPDGTPPVAVCYQDWPEGNAKAALSWQPGIWGALRMSQKNCEDWPEIYLEIARVLKLLKKV